MIETREEAGGGIRVIWTGSWMGWYRVVWVRRAGRMWIWIWVAMGTSLGGNAEEEVGEGEEEDAEAEGAGEENIGV